MVAYKQSTSDWFTVPTTTKILPYSNPLSPGGFLACAGIWNDITDVCSIADDDLNNWLPLSSPQNGLGLLSSFRLQMFMARNSTGGASTTVTGTFSPNAVSTGGIAILEYSGLSPIDPTDGVVLYNTQLAATSFTTQSISAQAGDLILAACLTSGDIGSVNGPFNLREDIFFGDNAVADLLNVAAGSYSCTFNDIAGGNQDALMVIGAFKQSGLDVLQQPVVSSGSRW